MDDNSINVLLTTFAGLRLPRTLSLPFSRSTPIQEVADCIYDRLPSLDQSLSLTTTSNRAIDPSSADTLDSLLSTSDAHIIPLRLRALVFGGKGGFGSQLRAAGGRMSSRKNRNQQNQPQNGSNRNLDGRRLRTVDAAKKLADYLTQKPEMEAREKEERRKKWETVVDMANRREDDIKSGKLAPRQGRLDAEYVESKELAEEKTREAIMQAMKSGGLAEGRTGSETSMDAMHEGNDDELGEGQSESSDEAPMESGAGISRTFFGWDEEDDEDDDSESDTDHRIDIQPEPAPPYEGKGKAKVT